MFGSWHPIKGQFPASQGKQASSLFPMSSEQNSASNLPISYDISKSELKFSYQLVESLDRFNPDRWAPKKLRSFDFAVGLKDFVFNVGNGKNFEIKTAFTPIGNSFNDLDTKTDLKRNKKVLNNDDKSARDRFLTYTTGIYVKYGRKENVFDQSSEEIDSIFSIQGRNYLDVGLVATVARLWDLDGYAKTGFGFRLYIGRTINDPESLKKRQLCTNSQTGFVDDKLASVADCKEVLLGNETSSIESRIAVDFSWRITKPFKGLSKKDADKALPRFNNPALFILTRSELKLNTDKKRKLDAYMGFSLAKRNRQPLASLLFNVSELFGDEEEENQFAEVPNIQAVITVPIQL